MGMDAYIRMLVEDARRGGDLLEQLEAGQECEHGHMPFDGDRKCECWPARQVPKLSRARKLTDREVRAAHRRHLKGVSVRQLAHELWQRAGYSSPQSCDVCLRRLFRTMGLEVRPRAEASRLANATHGLTARQRDPVKFNEWQRQRRAKRPQCHALRVDGTRCPYRAQEGHYLCGTHARNAGQLGVAEEAA